MSTPYPKGGKPGDTGLNGVDCYGGVKDVKEGLGTGAVRNIYDDDTYPTADLPKGVTEYGGTPSKNEQPTNLKSTSPTTSIKGVDEYGGTSNNTQTGKTVNGKWQ